MDAKAKNESHRGDFSAGQSVNQSPNVYNAPSGGANLNTPKATKAASFPQPNLRGATRHKYDSEPTTTIPQGTAKP